MLLYWWIIKHLFCYSRLNLFRHLHYILRIHNSSGLTRSFSRSNFKEIGDFTIIDYRHYVWFDWNIFRGNLQPSKIIYILSPDHLNMCIHTIKPLIGKVLSWKNRISINEIKSTLSYFFPSLSLFLSHRVGYWYISCIYSYPVSIPIFIYSTYPNIILNIFHSFLHGPTPSNRFLTSILSLIIMTISSLFVFSQRI